MPRREMRLANLTAEAAAVTAGAYLVVSGYPLLGVLWFSAGIYLRKTTRGGRRS